MKKSTMQKMDAGRQIRGEVQTACTLDARISGKRLFTRMLRNKELRKQVVLFQPSFIPGLVKMCRAGVDVTKPNYALQYKETSTPNQATGTTQSSNTGTSIRQTSIHCREVIFRIYREKPSEAGSIMLERARRELNMAINLKSFKTYLNLMDGGIDISADNYSIVARKQKAAQSVRVPQRRFSEPYLHSAFDKVPIVPPRTDEPASFVKAVAADVKNSNIIHPTNEQIIDSIIWMASELKRVREEYSTLADRNAVLVRERDKAVAEYKRVVSAHHKALGQLVELEQRRARGEDSLTERQSH